MWPVSYKRTVRSVLTHISPSFHDLFFFGGGVCQARIRITLPWSLRSDYLALSLPRWLNAWCSCHVLLRFPCLERAVYTTIVWWVKLKASLVNCGCPFAKDMALQRQCVQTSLLHSRDFMLLSLRLEREKKDCFMCRKTSQPLYASWHENCYSWRITTFYDRALMFWLTKW